VQKQLNIAKALKRAETAALMSGTTTFEELKRKKLSDLKRKDDAEAGGSDSPAKAAKVSVRN